MGLLDKAKAAAERAASEAKKGAAQVQEKVEQVQTRKRADELAARLGYLLVRERQGQAPAEEDKERLVTDIIALEAQLAGGTAAGAAPSEGSAPAPEPPTSASEPSGGDFKLD